MKKKDRDRDGDEGTGVLNCRRAAANGTAVASRTPRKGIRFRNALTIPRVTAPFIPRTKNTKDVPAAMMDPMIRFPSTIRGSYCPDQ